jgi:hypothetical protein
MPVVSMAALPELLIAAAVIAAERAPPAPFRSDMVGTPACRDFRDVGDAEIFKGHAGTVIAALHNRLGGTSFLPWHLSQVGPIKIGIRP